MTTRWRPLGSGIFVIIAAAGASRRARLAAASAGVIVVRRGRMKTALLLIGLLVGGMFSLAGPSMAADAADAAAWWRAPSAPVEVLPFPRSNRAQAIWDGGACWDECGAYTAWNLVGCLYRDRQGRCLKHTDAADRACQRECRLRGGPYLPIDTLFPLGE